MPDTFHHFPLLPFELRDIIWKLAVRPAVPGAHIFSIYPDLFNCTEPEGFSWAFQAFHPYEPVWCLGAPRCLPKATTFTRESLAAAPTSWLRNNPSAYLIDSGLWSACKESRRVIEHAFRCPEYHGHADWGISKSVMDENDCSNSQEQNAGLFGLPGVTSYATREGDERRLLSVIPRRDLFILQVSNLSEFYEIWICDTIPFYDPDGLTEPSLEHWANYQIALEYDPLWDKVSTAQDDSPDRQIIKDLAPDIADTKNSIQNFWLIDYRIKPKRIGRKVFLGTDRRYVEVVRGEGSDGEDGSQEVGPWGFIQTLKDELADYEDLGEEWDNVYHRIEVGLLACEYL